MTTAALRSGPCAPWITADNVLSQPGCGGLDPTLAATMATVASETLYVLSGQQFTGACGPVTVRPISRPIDADTRFMANLVGMGWLSSWGTCTAYGTPLTGGVAHYGCSNPPEIELGAYPITSIDLVKLDGIVIPPNEYYLQDHRSLVRLRPSAAATPTQRFGWPTCQLMDLPDTEIGTFAVTYHYGVPPPQSGILAASVLAGQLGLDQSGSDTRLPRRVTSISRQGMTAMIVDVMDFLKEGLTGIYEVDLFLHWANPSGSKMRSFVWSPDIGRPKRMPSTVV
jgi:hypothetical protein